ncbi:MAG: FimV/HubP family polar landmark protein [Gammaproteobacteria bacterium]
MPASIVTWRRLIPSPNTNCQRLLLSSRFHRRYRGLPHIGPIEEGTELWTIAADLSEMFHASTEQVMVGLFEANPRSFCYRNLNCLKVGAYLDLPAANGIATTTSSEARRILQSHFRAWRQRGRTDALTDATRKEVMTP